jgi:hypothetical protein
MKGKVKSIKSIVSIPGDATVHTVEVLGLFPSLMCIPSLQYPP